ncbi:hypothetical protein ACJX0J_042221, partial [Zea mays]
ISITCSPSNYNEGVVERELHSDCPIHQKVLYAGHCSSIYRESDLPSKVQEQPMTTPIPTGTPKKGERMANVLDTTKKLMFIEKSWITWNVFSLVLIIHL